jgi:hypothetical protein
MYKRKGLTKQLSLIGLHQKELKKLEIGKVLAGDGPEQCSCDCDCNLNPEGKNTAQVNIMAPDVTDW